MINQQPNSYGNAAQAYKQVGQSALNPVEIVVALYEGILKNLEEAKNAYSEQNLEEMCLLNEKTFRILGALQAHLDFENGGETAPALNDFYKIVFVRLTNILQKEDPVSEFDYLRNNVRDVYEKWSLLSKKVMDQQRSIIAEQQERGQTQGKISIQE